MTQSDDDPIAKFHERIDMIYGVARYAMLVVAAVVFCYWATSGFRPEACCLVPDAGVAP